MDKESKIFKLRLEQEYIQWQIYQHKHTYNDLKQLDHINRLLRKLTK
jgi:hypothetical protein